MAGDSGSLTFDQHVQLNHQDSLNNIAYSLTWMALRAIGPENKNGFVRNIPKRAPRPGEAKPVLVFANKRDLAEVEGIKKKGV